jgi:hypothetical protein
MRMMVVSMGIVVVSAATTLVMIKMDIVIVVGSRAAVPVTHVSYRSLLSGVVGVNVVRPSIVDHIGPLSPCGFGS